MGLLLFNVPILILLFMSTTLFTIVKSEQKVPCYFIFGDSLSDVGNNNNLRTKAKANYPPYGVDFPGGVATGRFSNGLTFVDRISQLLGFEEFIPSYSAVKSQTFKHISITKGVNYASGAAGIRAETGQHLGDRLSMEVQLRNHAKIVTLIALLGKAPSLRQCLYTVNMGNNDYINNYLLPQYYPSSSLYTPEKYAELLIRQYQGQLEKLYNYGARKVAIFGVGQIGCTLAEIYMHPPNGSLCVDNVNNAVDLFNQKLISLVDYLNDHLPGAQFTYINTGGGDTGSLIVNNPCCEVREDFQCKVSAKTCSERGNYIFWDGFHTTEIANIASGESAFNSIDKTITVHPMDISTLLSTGDNLSLLKKETIATNPVSATK